MQSGFMDKKAGFEGEWDDPDIGWIDGKDNGDKTWDPGGRSKFFFGNFWKILAKMSRPTYFDSLFVKNFLVIARWTAENSNLLAIFPMSKVWEKFSKQLSKKYQLY